MAFFNFSAVLHVPLTRESNVYFIILNKMKWKYGLTDIEEEQDGQYKMN
jgi:hypothetical protein